ncbi:MAG: hypothetical protein AABX35_02095 [Nanoarchaeota archaeon]
MTQLTNEYLRRFAGGQLEVQNPVEEYLFRGEIETANIDKGDLVVKLKWNAIGVGYPPLPNKWVKDTDDSHLNYRASLDAYLVTEMSEQRTILNSPVVNEIAALYSKDGSRLDSSRVEGLVLEK